MSITSDLSLVDDYVLRCEPFLADLTPALGAQLQDDIRRIVGEVTSELDGFPDDLVGPPQRFVAELRLAAGVAVPDAIESSKPTPTSAAGDAVVRWLSQAVVPWLRQLATDLRPAWWVSRGIGLAYVLGFVTGGAGERSGVVPDVLGSNLLGLIAMAGLVVVSVERGRNGDASSRRRTWIWIAASVIGLYGLGVGIDGIRNPTSDFAIVEQAPLAMDTAETFADIAAPRAMTLYVNGDAEPLVANVTSYPRAIEFLAELQADQYPATELRLELGDPLIREVHNSLTYNELESALKAFFGYAG